MTAHFKQSPPKTEERATNPANAIQAALDRQLLQGLLAEWENALWLLPAPLRRMIRKPLFSIREMPGKLGTWDNDKREITLSRDLVNGGRWDDVREVLLHEMSHQVAHEGLKSTSETDHGKGFQKACRLLRANPKASGFFHPLHARLHRGETLSGRDKIAVKIHKLMALAESSNIHEARAAMHKAHQLILHHNIDLIENNSRQDYHSLFIGKPRLKHFREAYHLAHLLQDYYFVQGMWIQAWVLEKGKMGRVLEISGTLANIQIADYVHESICRYIDTTWLDYRRDKKLNRFRKTDYAIGILEGFRTTLERSVATSVNIDDSNLPVNIKDQSLTRFVAQRYPHVRSFTRHRSKYSPKVLNDGRKKGRNLVVSKGITQRKGYEECLLENNGGTEQV